MRFVPQYLEAQEINAIPGFIAEIADDIPGSRLVFHTNYFLTDLLVTPREDAVVWYEMPGWELTGCS